MRQLLLPSRILAELADVTVSLNRRLDQLDIECERFKLINGAGETVRKKIYGSLIGAFRGVTNGKSQ